MYWFRLWFSWLHQNPVLRWCIGRFHWHHTNHCGGHFDVQPSHIGPARRPSFNCNQVMFLRKKLSWLNIRSISMKYTLYRWRDAAKLCALLLINANDGTAILWRSIILNRALINYCHVWTEKAGRICCIHALYLYGNVQINVWFHTKWFRTKWLHTQCLNTACKLSWSQIFGVEIFTWIRLQVAWLIK